MLGPSNHHKGGPFLFSICENRPLALEYYDVMFFVTTSHTHCTVHLISGLGFCSYCVSKLEPCSKIWLSLLCLNNRFIEIQFMQFTHLNCTIQQILVCLQSCAIITIVNFGTFSLLWRETPTTISHHSPRLPSLLSPRQPTIFVLSLWTGLF